MCKSLHATVRPVRCIWVLSLFILSISAHAATLYVSPSGGNNPPYASWADAANSIADALGEAGNNDTVIVTNGVYSESAQIDINNNGLTLKSVNGPEVTIIDGLGSHRVIYSNNRNVTIDGFTITNGYVNDHGAGLYLTANNNNNRHTLTNCIIVANKTQGNNRRGAGLRGQNVYVYDCIFRTNQHAGGGTPRGGGAYLAGTIMIKDSTFSYNSARDGGGLYNNNANAIVTNCTFYNNQANRDGGGVFFNDGGTLSGSIAYNNSAGDDGGGAFFNNAAGTVVASVIYSNTVTDNGGGIYIYNQGTVESTKVYGNTADDQGGGIWILNDAILNSLDIYDNTANNQGGGACLYANATITNCTIKNNTSDLDGGGAFIDDTATLLASTIDNNSADRDGGGVYFNSNGSIAFSDILNNSVNGDGGGACLIGTCVVTNSSFVNNDAGRYGGGIYIDYTATEVAYSTFDRNKTTIAGIGNGGGGVYAGNNAYVHHCNFTYNNAQNDGGGILFDGGGSLSYSILSHNTAGDWGGGVAVYFNGSVTNCLIHNNSADEGGGIYLYSSGTIRIDSCTVANNIAYVGAGGVDCQFNPSVYNCISYDNVANVFTNYRNQNTGARWYNSCTYPEITGAPDAGGNITNNPQFLSPATYLYQLDTNSPCIDTGQNQAWMTGAEDLTPQSRIINSVVDMGAYEFGKLLCFFKGTPRVGPATLPVSFTSWVLGNNMSSLTYYWDFDYPSTSTTNGLNLDQVTWNYTTDGVYTVALVVSNTAGETAICKRVNYIYVMPSVRYVATNGPHISPFASWETAASNIESAVALSLDDMKVYVSGGVYRVSSPILCTNAVTVESVDGPEKTIVDGKGVSRAFHISADAFVTGFTFSNCVASGSGFDSYGGGAFLDTFGTVSNCHFTMNSANYGGGAACYGGGTLHTCTFKTNSANYGGGVSTLGAALVMNCILQNNTVVNDGGGIYSDASAILRNCLAFHNTAGANGGGISARNSTVYVQNCTSAHNHANRGGGTHTQSGGRLINTISFFNTADTAANSNWYSHIVGNDYGISYEYCCIAPLTGLPSPTANIEDNPRFRSSSINDYHLLTDSPCINAGLNQAWMTGNVDLDFNPRIRENTVDMGVYECILATLKITNTTDYAVYPFRHISHILAGTSTGLVGQLVYSNTWTDGYNSGAFVGNTAATTTWDTAVHLPHYGTYTFTIIGTNVYEDVVQDSVKYIRKKQQVHLIRRP